MPMSWNETADAKLLIGILHTSSVKLDFAALAQYMGPDCTVSAVQHRIQRLKDKVSAGAGTDSASGTPVKKAGAKNAGAGTESAVSTTKKRGRPPKNPAPGPEGASPEAGGVGTGTPQQTPTQSRKRGRPKKVNSSEKASDDNSASASASASASSNNVKFEMDVDAEMNVDNEDSYVDIGADDQKDDDMKVKIEI
ncbi:hypothetical protein BO70DRAFT_427886 [Aspergillus heteromorphus CBS 117.55]|uniref:AT hook motif protein n=1 Tax=Aspergillus heteromorphus CBS 117.55 TaxID=1448321 RepID=A0A317WMF2_9EURO|nr:uncharacterized protein BO70DRAFT_427886 [Aspergillus heteromorphus CBS 117.55]PWY86891.1 hypothetical protein BO70DRAFT_427886 [Aspergillus heteromorphus CBS 117.55]